MGNVYDYVMEDINGDPVPLSEYQGDVILIVNVASKCGYTPQYAGLQKLYEKYKDKGFTILAFPSNEFGYEEPGTNEEIREFCETNYGVTFPIFAKITVLTESASPLYRFLTKDRPEIKWNFEKFLIDREGNIVKRYKSKAEPAEIEEDLKILV